MIPPGRPMDRETLARQVELLGEQLLSEGRTKASDVLRAAVEQLRDAATMAPQTSRSELMRHAVQRGGRPMDVAATVGEQTPALAPFEPDESNECGNCQTRGFSLQCTAVRGHAGLHVAHNPAGKVLATWEVGWPPPTEPPPADDTAQIERQWSDAWEKRTREQAVRIARAVEYCREVGGDICDDIVWKLTGDGPPAEKP